MSDNNEHDDLFGEKKTLDAGDSAGQTEDKLFGGSNPTEISLDDDSKDTPVEKTLPESTPVIPTSNTSEILDPPSLSTEDPKSQDEVEEEESGDSFDISIKISDPFKVGDGMSAYMAYNVNTNTSSPAFKSSEFSVKRRFSDFLGLHERLQEKHILHGRFVPPPPDKSVVGMVKVKGSKEDQTSTDFTERRKHSLEKYLNRVARHKVLVDDPDFKQFLEADELPRAKNTSALSKGGLSRLAKGIGEAVSKMTAKMVEPDSWFEEKQVQVDNLDQQLRKLHIAAETLVQLRRDVHIYTGSFSKSCSLLSSSEEHDGLSRALSSLSQLEENIEQIQQEQSHKDFYLLSETLKEYIGLIASVKASFTQRTKVWHNWQSAQTTLNKKREALVKLELAGKAEKITPAQEEVKEWERRVEKGEEDFESISKEIKIEMVRFDKMRIGDFKELIIEYLETLLNVQQQFVKLWEGFLPEAKTIC